MEPLNEYTLPDNIRQLEFHKDKSELKTFEKLFSEPKSKQNYIERWTTLIHMEEAANMRPMKDYDLKGVKIKIDSENLTFTVVSNL